MRSSPEGDRKALWSLPQERNPRITTRTLYDNVTTSIARKGQGRNSLAYFSSPLAFMASYCSIEIRQRRGFAPSFAEMMPRCSISSTKRPARA